MENELIVFFAKKPQNPNSLNNWGWKIKINNCFKSWLNCSIHALNLNYCYIYILRQNTWKAVSPSLIYWMLSSESLCLPWHSLKIDFSRAILCFSSPCISNNYKAIYFQTKIVKWSAWPFLVAKQHFVMCILHFAVPFGNLHKILFVHF